MSKKHTLLIGGDDGNVYRITSDDLQNYKVSQDEPNIAKLRKSFDGGLNHGVVKPGAVPPGEEPPNCTAALSAGEYVHFVNLATSASSEKD